MQKNLLEVMPFVIALIAFVGLMVIGGRCPPAKAIGSKIFFEGLLAKKRRNSNGGKLKDFLVRNGVSYHYGKKCNEIKLIVVSILIACGLWIVLFRISIWLSILAALSSFVFPWIMLPILNKKDNEKMLPDIKTIYQALAMQIKAGIYVMDALAECYGSVVNNRLKDALLDLGGDIVMKADIVSALEKFQSKFENRYIDSLCIIILQAMESGQAVELLSDISEQVKDMEKAVLDKKKGNLDRSITFYQLGMLSCILAIAVYACINYMLSAAVGL